MANKKTPEKKTPKSKIPAREGSLTQCAFELNLGKRRVQDLAREGMPKAGDRGVYLLDDCLRWYVRYLQGKMKERAVPEDEDGDGGGPASASSATRHKLLQIEFEIKQLDLAERRDQLISVDRVQQDFAKLVLEIKTRILALPPRLAAEVLGEMDLAIAQVKIDKSLKAALEALSQYDPDRTTDHA